MPIQVLRYDNIREKQEYERAHCNVECHFISGRADSGCAKDCDAHVYFKFSLEVNLYTDEVVFR